MDGDPCPIGAVVAVDDAASVSHLSAISHSQPNAPNILTNDEYMPPSHTIHVTHQPIHGLLTGPYADGTFDYDPDDNYVGHDLFVYYISQGTDESSLAIVTIHVTNSFPVANPDDETVMGGSATFNVITDMGGVDTDADGDDIDIAEITDWPDKGTLSVNFETGEVGYTYTGPPGQNSDLFKYKAKDDWDQSNETVVNLFIMGMALILDQPEIEPSAVTRSITDADLALLAGEAARRWVLAGVDPITAQKALDGTKFVVADLPGSMIGAESPGTIVIDVNAAGYGWFVDETPALDEEFSILVSASERQAVKGSDAFGRADLLAAVMHEFGHALGMAHLEGGEFEHSVMHDTLGLSMRRVPMAADVLASDEYFAWLAGTGSTIKRRTW